MSVINKIKETIEQKKKSNVGRLYFRMEVATDSTIEISAHLWRGIFPYKYSVVVFVNTSIVHQKNFRSYDKAFKYFMDVVNELFEYKKSLKE